MSINNYSVDLPETTLWWPQQLQQPILMEPTPNPSSTSWPYTDPLRLNLNHQNDDVEEDEEEEDQTTTTTHQEETEDEKEPMFEKPLTPSDVGKLNRLVIPKQHAEKYFPLSGGGGGGGGGDSSECKGLLLSFEDESGKCWRFRYSYWNSSQSYVLTKGWSRYVKDKRLDAGDVVLFERHRADAHRLFIGWRRRRHGDTSPVHVNSRAVGHGKSGDGNSKNEAAVTAGGMGWTRGFYSAHPYPTHQHQLHNHQPSPYQYDSLHAGRGSEGERAVGNRNSGSSRSSSRVLRLFGVNMECEAEHDSGPSTPQCSYNTTNMPSTQATHTLHHFYHHHQPSSHPPPPPPPPPHHMLRHQPYYY